MIEIGTSALALANTCCGQDRVALLALGAALWEDQTVKRLLLALVLVAAVSATLYNVWPRPDSQGVWVVTLAPDPSVGHGWAEAGSGQTGVGSALRTFARWEPIDSTSPRSLQVLIDDYGTVQTARALERSPEKSVSAPNFEVRSLGDDTLLPVNNTKWDDYVVCGNGTPSQCAWWYYLGRFDRFRVTVILQDDVGAPLTSDEFAAEAITLFDAANDEIANPP